MPNTSNHSMERTVKKIVVKFGGSVLKEPSDFKKILSAVRSYSQYLIIVVSALYGVTDKLSCFLKKGVFNKKSIDNIIEYLKELHFTFININIDKKSSSNEIRRKILILLKQLKNYLTGLQLISDVPDFSHSYVLSFGERLSSNLISLFLNHYGIVNSVALPEKIGLYSYDSSDRSGVDFNRSIDSVKKNLSPEKNYIIPGFYGISEGSRISVFGRGGSDYTAASIAKCIDAEFLDLWKDVEGFMTSDPKIVKEVKPIEHLSYEEAAELSYFGAKIIHPGAFIPIKERNIELRIFGLGDISGKYSPATVINSKRSVVKDVIKSITYDNDISILRLKGANVGEKPGIIAVVSKKFNKAGINIKSIITSQTSINFLLSTDDIKESFKILENIESFILEEISIIDDISILAAVGEGIGERFGIASKILSALNKEKINVRIISLGASETSMYLIIDDSDCKKALTAIHKEFFNRIKDKK